MFPMSALERSTFEAMKAGTSDSTETPIDTPATPKPWTTASKNEWADYARSVGVEVDGLTKAQIVEACK